MRKDHEAALSRTSESKLRCVGWRIILQEQNTLNQLSSSHSWHNRLTSRHMTFKQRRLNVDASTLRRRCIHAMCPLGYCPFDISRKDVFCLAFYFEWKYFVLIVHILSETICLFYFCVLFSNIYSKIKFTARSWSDLCNFYSKVIFGIFYLWKYFFFFAEF